MKPPAMANNYNGNDDDDDPNNDSSFLDDDFLSLYNHDNIGGRHVDRPPPDHYDEQRAPVVVRPATVPWLMDGVTTTPSSLSMRQQQQLRRDQDNNINHREYGENSAYNHRRTPAVIRLHNEIVSFVDLMSPTVDEMKLRDKMVKRVTKLAQTTFSRRDLGQPSKEGKEGTESVRGSSPGSSRRGEGGGSGTGVTVLPFGSQVTGLCLPGSDIDLVIRLSSRGTGEEPSDSSSLSSGLDNPLRRFADAVLDEFGTRSELLEKERGQEVANSDRDDDANDDDYDNVHDKEYLSYLEVIEQTRVPLVKFTIAPHNIDIDVCFDQPHGPESAELMHRFMESMPPLRPMTIVLKYFLASRDVNKPFTGGIGSYLLQLMIVSYLQHRAREDVAKRHGASGKHYNLGSLLLDFLELYGLDFNYVTTGISVRHDGYYFPKGLRDRRDSFWQSTRPFSLAMENPLDPNADVGAGAFRMQMIQRVFGHAFRTLLAYVSEPAMDTDSILARIIPPTKEMECRMIAKLNMDAIVFVGNDDKGDNIEEVGGSGGDPKRCKLLTLSHMKRRNDGDDSQGDTSYGSGGRQGGGGEKKRGRHST